MKKIKKVCEKCGSTEIVSDAWAYWDEDDQEWKLETFFDYIWCKGCESETNIKEIEIKDEEKEEGKT